MGDDVESLAARARAGDRAALDTLLGEHLATVYRFVSVKMGFDHAELDDIVQETLIGASGSIRGLRGETDAQVAGWLLSIARHKVADHLRSRYARPQESVDGPAGAKLQDLAQPVDEVVLARDRTERLRQALKTLTPEQEEVLVLRFILGFGIREVAEITHRPEGAVKSMQHRAIANLQQKLDLQERAWT